MRRVLALGSLIAMVGAAAYACANDTFGQGDAAAEAGGPQDPISEFCDAAAMYDKRCFPDASCIADNASNCAYAAAQLSPALISAYAACQAQLACGTDLFTAIGQTCMQKQLASFANDSGVLVKLSTEICVACYPTSIATCESDFAEAGTAGGFFGLFSDTIISGFDVCIPKDAGTSSNGDASVCATTFGVCALAKLSLSIPKDACQDGGF